MDTSIEMTKDSTFIHWKVCAIEPMTAREAMAYQIRKGYHPAGYNFESFKCVKELDSNGRDYFVHTWTCYASCD